MDVAKHSNALQNFYHGTPYQVIKNVVIDKPHICGLCQKPYRAGDTGTLVVEPETGSFCIFHPVCVDRDVEKDSKTAKLIVLPPPEPDPERLIGSDAMCLYAAHKIWVMDSHASVRPEALANIVDMPKKVGTFEAACCRLEHRNLLESKASQNPSGTNHPWTKYRITDYGRVCKKTFSNRGSYILLLPTRYMLWGTP
jgi:hypothetical protein